MPSSTSLVAQGLAPGAAYQPTGAGAQRRTILSKLRDRCSPKDFGAVADGVTDDAAALQAFFDYVESTDVGVADVAGIYKTSVGLTYGRLVTPQTKHFQGRLRLNMTGTGTYALTIKNWNQGSFEYLDMLGTGSTSTFSSKTWHTGVLFDNSARNSFRYIHVNKFAFAGIAAGLNNNTLNDYGFIKATDCGSGARSSQLTTATKYGLSTTISSLVNSGSAGSTSQATTVTVGTLPPSYIQSGEFGAVGDAQYMIRVTNLDGTKRLHWIQSIDAANSKVTVQPWISSTVDTTQTCDYVWGGGLYLRGNDSNVCSFRAIDGLRCGIALAATSLYAPTADRVVTQFCGIGIALGRYPGGAVLGGKISGGYFESNQEDIIHVSRPTVTSYNWINSEYALDLTKTYVMSAPRLADNSFSTTYTGFKYTSLGYRGRNLSWEKYPLNSNTGKTFDLNRPDMVIPYLSDSPTVSLAALNRRIHEMFGYDTVRIIVIGTGTNGAPTGNITFTRPTIDENGDPDTSWTINGGTADVVYTPKDLTNAGVAQFVCRFNAVTNDLKVVPANMIAVRSSTVEALPTSPADGLLMLANNEIGGATLVFSIGGVWKRSTDNAVAAGSGTMVVNGTFDDATGWTLPHVTETTISGGTLNYNATTASRTATTTLSVATVIGGVYRIAYSLTRTLGSFRATFGGVTGTLRSATGSYTEDITATSASTTLSLIGSSSTTCTVDNLSITRLS